MDTPNVAHLYHEVIGRSVSEPEMRELYQVRFPAYIELGIAFQRLDPRLRYFDLTQLALAIDSTRDQAFGCNPRYLLTQDGAHVELPQWFWMRVAMGLALTELDANRTARAIDWYHTLSTSVAQAAS